MSANRLIGVAVVLLLASSCKQTVVPHDEAAAQEVRIIITEAQASGRREFYVVHDNETGHDYLVVCGGSIESGCGVTRLEDGSTKR